MFKECVIQFNANENEKQYGNKLFLTAFYVISSEKIQRIKEEEKTYWEALLAHPTYTSLFTHSV